MRADPKVTVVIPTYNMAAFLETAIESVLCQTFEDFELLVLDNASTDGTPAVMVQYTDPRVSYRRNKQNLGLAGNIGRGIRDARGQYIAFLGADDIWEPRYLAEAVAFLDLEPRVSMVHGAAVWIDQDGRMFGGTGRKWQRLTPCPLAMFEAFERGFCFASMLIRTAALRATGPFDERWQEVIDLWIFLRMCLAGDIGYLDEVLCQYRVHDQAMSMPMYRQNLMFRRMMTAAREAFAWPEAISAGAASYRRAAERSAARIAIDVLHRSRADGLRQYFRNLAEVVHEVPEVLLSPYSWARIAFGVLPFPVIERLTRLRGRFSVARAKSISARAGW